MNATLYESLNTFHYGIREPIVTGWKREENERRQNIARTKAMCSEPSISSLLERFGYELTLETLELDDETFTAFYPDIALGPLARKDLKEAVVKHVQGCSHCKLVAENHRMADAQLDIAIAHEKIKKSSARAKATAAGA
jgi:hypothetical protein